MFKTDELAHTDINAYLAQHERKELLRLITCGSVDDGKSTLIGRLLHDTRLIYEDTLAAIHRDSAKVGTTGKGNIDLALLVDGLQAEREQGITIDVAYRYFSTDQRKFIIADCPGHEQYTRNMATGASTCDLAVILIDARHGVLVQTKRHSFIVSLLGIKHVVVAINKMDLVGFSQARFEEIREEYAAFATQLGIDDLQFIPISALNGDNVVEASESMPWYTGGALLNHLETVHIGSDRNFKDFRFPVQYVTRPNLNFRGFAGTVASGLVRVGDQIISLPNGARSRVKAIVTMDGELKEAFPPMAVTLTLEDEIDASRGDVLVHPDNVPRVEREFEAMIVWMNGESLTPGRQYLFKVGTNAVTGTVTSIRYGVDVNTLATQEATKLDLNQVGRCQISLNRAIPFDAYSRNRATGAFIIIDRLTNATLGAGMISDIHGAEAGKWKLWEQSAAPMVERSTSPVSSKERETKLQQKAAVILLTGLTGSGKSAIAYELERRLFEAGRHATVLDGQTMRAGLSKDLGFSHDDRSENLRRAAEVARILADSGLIAICSFVAPDADVRAKVKDLIGADRFLEVHVNAPIEVCRQRDVKGMYARADAGELENFPSLAATYQTPAQPDLMLPTDQLDTATCVDRLMKLLEVRGILL
ncbi:sulfate adenylyltransferase subunit CysN [soil metagenome]